MAWNIGALFLLLAGSAFFSATETAFTSLSSHQIHHIGRTAGRRGRGVKRLSAYPSRLLTTILIGNNLANIGAAAVVTLMTEELFGAGAVSVASGLLTLVVLIFCEVSPKRIAIAHNRRLALATALPLTAMGFVLRPIVLFVTWVSSLITRFFTRSGKSDVSLDGILSMVAAGESEGIIKGYEGRMVKSIFRLDDIPTGTVMTHRTDVFAVARSRTIGSIVEEVIEEGYSRIPVYDEDPEHIVGIALAKEMLRAFATGRSSDRVGDWMKQPIFVPEARKINEVFATFQKERLKMAVVLDEYGGLAGIVTLEDIAEEVFGEIFDETDEHVYETITRIGKRRFRIAADTSLPMIHDALGIALPKGRSDQTLGAYILDRLERIPQQGETVIIGGFQFQIERMDENRIEVVTLMPPR